MPLFINRMITTRSHEEVDRSSGGGSHSKLFDTEDKLHASVLIFSSDV